MENRRSLHVLVKGIRKNAVPLLTSMIVVDINLGFHCALDDGNSSNYSYRNIMSFNCALIIDINNWNLF